MRPTRVRRIVAILVVLACASYLVLNAVDGVRLWLAYRSCNGSCGFVVGTSGPFWVVVAVWAASLIAAAAVGIWLTRRLVRRSPASESP